MFLSIRNLWAKKDGKQILKKIDLDVQRGEVLVIFGPNGAGKSTLLKAIMGVGGFKVSGKIIFEGKNVTQLPPFQRARMGIALAYQFPPEIEGVKVSELEELLAKRFGGRPTLELKVLRERELFVGMSGGERKLVELYITSFQNPKLIMLDEPDSGVDIENVERVAGQINRWIDEGRTIMLVTHSGAILDYLKRTDRAIVMRDGKIVCEGDVDEVFERLRREGYGC